jgi:hypothetical protein
MDNHFDITINYKGESTVFAGEFIPAGFSYKIIVDLNGHPVSFEPDEERNFRALVNAGDQWKISAADKAAIEGIATELMRMFRSS